MKRGSKTIIFSGWWSSRESLLHPFLCFPWLYLWLFIRESVRQLNTHTYAHQSSYTYRSPYWGMPARFIRQWGRSSKHWNKPPETHQRERPLIPFGQIHDIYRRYIHTHVCMCVSLASLSSDAASSTASVSKEQIYSTDCRSARFHPSYLLKRKLLLRCHNTFPPTLMHGICIH